METTIRSYNFPFSSRTKNEVLGKRFLKQYHLDRYFWLIILSPLMGGEFMELLKFKILSGDTELENQIKTCEAIDLRTSDKYTYIVILVKLHKIIYIIYNIY